MLFNFAPAREAARTAKTGHCRRRLYGRDRAYARGLSQSGRTARDRAHRRSAPPAVGDGAACPRSVSTETRRDKKPRIARSIARYPIWSLAVRFNSPFCLKAAIPTTWCAAARQEALAKLLAHPIALIDVLWSREQARHPLETPEQRASLEARLMELAGQIEHKSLKYHYIAAFRERLRAAGRTRAASPRAAAARPGYGTDRVRPAAWVSQAGGHFQT